MTAPTTPFGPTKLREVCVDLWAAYDSSGTFLHAFENKGHAIGWAGPSGFVVHLTGKYTR